MSRFETQVVLLSLAVAAICEIALGFGFNIRWLAVLAAVQVLALIRCAPLAQPIAIAGETGVASRHQSRLSQVVVLLSIILGALAVGTAAYLGTLDALPQLSSVVQRTACGMMVLQTCVWLVLRASIAEKGDIASNGFQVRLAIRATLAEQIAVAALAAVGLAVSAIVPSAPFWTARIISVWAIAIALESFVRVGFALAKRESMGVALCRPLFIHELCGLGPTASTVEPSSGSIQTVPGAAASVRSALMGAVALVLLAAWLTSGLVIVPIGMSGVYARLGRIEAEPLHPGLHFTLPAPLGAVRNVDTSRPIVVPLGFRSDAPDVLRESFLWTRPHRGEEFPILVGSGAEAVVVNGFVRCRIGEDSASVRNYVASAYAPEALLRQLAHQSLLEELRGLSFDAAVGTERVQLAERMQRRLHAAAQRYQLGLEVLDCGILSVHPPVEAAAAYLDVVSAQTEVAQKYSEARSAAAAELDRCRMMSDTAVADARANAARRSTSSTDQVTRFTALADVYASAPQVLHTRLTADTLATVLARRPLVLLDAELPSTARIVFDESTSSREAASR